MYVRFPAVATIMIAILSMVASTACRQEESPPAAGEAPPVPAKPAPQPTGQPDVPTESVTPTDTTAAAKPAQPDAAAPRTMSEEEFAIKAARKRRLVVEEAQARLLEKWNAIEAVSVIYESKYEQKTGLKQRGETRSKYDYLKLDSIVLVRYELVNRMIVARKEDEEIFTGENKTIIFDGEFEYALQTLHDRQLAYKRHYNPNKIQHVAGRQMFNQLRAFPMVERLLPEQIDGRTVEVFAYSNEDKTVHGKTYIDVETGIMAKFEMTSAATEQTLTATLLEMNLEPAFPEDHFTFVLPENTELIDETVPPPPAPKPAPAADQP